MKIKDIKQIYKITSIESGIINYENYSCFIYQMEIKNIFLLNEQEINNEIKILATLLSRVDNLRIYCLDQHDDLRYFSTKLLSNISSYTDMQSKLANELSNKFLNTDKFEKKYYLSYISEDNGKYEDIFNLLYSTCKQISELSIIQTEHFVYNLLNRNHLENNYILDELDNILPSNIHVERSNLKIDKNYVKYYIIKNYPIETIACHLLFILNCEGINLMLQTKKTDQKKILKKIQARIKHAKAEINSTKVNDLDKSSYIIELNALEKISSEQIKNHYQYLEYEVIFEVISDDLESFKLLQIQLETQAQASNLELDNLELLQLDALTSFLPNKEMNIGYKHVNIASTISSLYPFSKSTIIEANGIYVGNAIGHSESSGSTILNLKSPRLSNNNMMIVGMSGMGKSSILKKIIFQQSLQTNNIIFSFDSDKHEYQYLTNNYGAVNINAVNNYINIFEFNPELKNYIYQINQIKIFVKIYCDELGFEELALLEKFIKVLYINFDLIKSECEQYCDNLKEFKSCDYPLFSDLYILLLTYQNTEMVLERKIIKKSYNKLVSVINTLAHGEDSLYFNNYTFFKLENVSGINFDILELRDLQTNIFNGQMFIYLNYIWNFIKQSKNQDLFKLIIIDELHLLVNRDSIQVAKWLNNIVKRIRKYNGGLIMATQQFSDLMDDQIYTYASSLLANPDFKLIYNLGDVDLQKVKQSVKLSDEDLKLVQNSGVLQALIRFANEKYYTQVEILESESLAFGNMARS